MKAAFRIGRWSSNWHTEVLESGIYLARAKYFMPDHRRHRGAHQQDATLFAPTQHEKLCAAVEDYSWLLTRGYASKSSLQLVGNRYQLAERQLMAVMRSSCAAQSQKRRQTHEVSIRDLAGQRLHLDGYNVLTTVEAALAGGYLFQGCDGCLRDIASLHGTFRRVEETVPALQLVGEALSKWCVAQVVWYFDQPVSNSGRLRHLLLQMAQEQGWNWQVEIVMNPDPVLAAQNEIIATGDGVILDVCAQWFNLARTVIERALPQSNVINLAQSPSTLHDGSKEIVAEGEAL